MKVWLHSTGEASPNHPNAAAALGTPRRLARLGATPDFRHGLLVSGRYCRLAQGQRYSNVNSLNRLLRLPVVQISGPDCQERDFGER